MDGWCLTYDGYDPATAGRREVLCALGNGYLVSRAALCFADAGGAHYPGTYMAGLYDRRTSIVGEREVENEDLVKLPDWPGLTFRIDDGPWVRSHNVRHLEHRQTLHLREGVLATRLRLADDHGRVTRVEERRLVSMHAPHLAALRLTLTPENWSGRLTVRSALDGRVENSGVERYRALEGRHVETLTAGGAEGLLWLRARTLQSRVEVAVAARLDVRAPTNAATERSINAVDDAATEVIGVEAAEGQAVTLEKVAAYVSGRDRAVSEPLAAARHAVETAARFDGLEASHAKAWQHHWDVFDLRLATADNDAAQLKLRLHLFQLLQTVSPHSVDRDVGVPPRGWHGEAYRGHIMWDELFTLPSLNLRMPELTRALLGYRFRRLPAAREAAHAVGLQGAMFPWQSGSNGREESQRWHLNPMSGRWVADNSWRQRHIGAAVAFNVWKYYQVTDDRQFLADYGAELLLEIARFWSSLAHERPDGRFELDGVMGPDEFHTAYPGADPSTEGGLKNNAYTNVMTAWVLARALEVVDILAEPRRRALLDLLALDEAELDRWDRVSRRLFVPLRSDGIIEQFEGFCALEPFPFAEYAERYPDLRRLDRILEQEDDHPNRYQVSKQADVLMLFYLFSREELEAIFERLGYRFEPAAIFKNIRYYMDRTVHGSTLSWLTHAWVMARADRERSWQLARTALDGDFADLQGGTTAEGIHLGAMAGTLDLMERCYTGLEVGAHALSFNPHLPEEVTCLSMSLRYQRQLLDVEVDHEKLTIASRPTTAAPITVAYRGSTRALSPGQRCVFKLVGEVKPDRAHREREQARVREHAESLRKEEASDHG